MVLTVPYEEFPAAGKRLGIHDVFVYEHGGHTHLTGADPHKSVLIASKTPASVEEVREHLKSAGFDVFSGQWSDQEASANGARNGEAYVAAVAYRSRESIPGLWMDAFPTVPTPQIVLRAMYDEFKENHEIGNATYEDFLSSAKPNVVILSPGEIETYLASKEEC